MYVVKNAVINKYIWKITFFFFFTLVRPYMCETQNSEMVQVLEIQIFKK